MKTTIYIEGGGDAPSLRSELRQSFHMLFEKAGFKGKLPKIVACGSRNSAFHDFKIAFESKKASENVLLLVDSEDPITSSTKWDHVITRDSWIKPSTATEEHLYFMVECMESWFLSDIVNLETFYGKNFKTTAFTNQPDLENISKQAIYDALSKATKLTQKGEYSKGNHSFKILAILDASKIKNHGQYTKELFDYLEAIL